MTTATIEVTATSTPAAVESSKGKKGKGKKSSQSQAQTPVARTTADKALAKAQKGEKGGKGEKVQATGKPGIARKGYESKHSELPQQEVVWNERRVAVVKAMRKLGATSQATSVTAGEVVAAAKLKDDTKPAIFRVRIVLDVYRTNELVHNGYVQSLRFEGERELRYYLTQRGVKVNLDKNKE